MDAHPRDRGADIYGAKALGGFVALSCPIGALFTGGDFEGEDGVFEDFHSYLILPEKRQGGFPDPPHPGRYVIDKKNRLKKVWDILSSG